MLFAASIILLAHSYFAPVSSCAWKMEDGEGRTVRFVADPAEPGLLVGEGEWSGEVDGSRAVVMTADSRNGRQFVNGRLVARLINGRTKPVRGRLVEKDLEFFQRLYASSANNGQDDLPDLWSDGRRLRLWYTNPNITAIFFVIFTVFGAYFALFGKSTLLRIAFGLEGMVSAACVFATGSRGGFIALVCGLCMLLIPRLRALVKPKTLICLFSVCLLFAVSLYLSGLSARFTSELFSQDKSNSRVEIWKSVPRMIYDSPIDGWGIGNSGRAYVDWYQEKPSCLLKNLVGSHFTNMVEYPLWGRLLYVFAWTWLLLWACRSVKRVSSLPLGLSVAMFVSAFFNPTWSYPELWVPLLGVFCWLAYRERKGLTLRLGLLVASLGVAVAFVASVYLVGALTSRKHEVNIVRSGNAVRIGTGVCKCAIWDDDGTLHGGYWWTLGRSVRNYYSANPNAGGIELFRDVRFDPKDAKRVVIVGRRASTFLQNPRPAADFADDCEFVFLSPDMPTEEILTKMSGSANVRVFRGEFAADLLGETAEGQKHVAVLKGHELYLSNWLDLALGRN